MKQTLLLCSLLVCTAFLQAQAKPTTYKFNGEQAVFTQNQGQIVDMNGQPVPDVLAKASMPGLDMYLTKTGVTYVLLKYTEDLAAKPHPVFSTEKKYKVTYSRVDVALTGATLAAEQLQLSTDAGWQSNYYKTADAKGQLAVGHFKNMTVQNVYPGIDWVWKFNATGNLEYEFAVHPGADPSVIKMQYRYADLTPLKSKLQISTRIGSMTEGPLLANNGSNKVAVNYNLEATTKTITFATGNYDHSKDLVIDPPLALDWSAQFGGSFLNGLRGVTTDYTSNIYLVGYTTSNDFPTFNPHITNQYLDTTYNGQSDAILLKMDTNQHLKWATYLGGPGNDFANSVCYTTATNQIYVTGGAASGFPVYGGGAANHGGQDAFISTFNNLLQLTYSSFYGGNGTDEGLKICMNKTNGCYITGYTNSTGNSFATYNFQGGYRQTTVTNTEAFIMGFNSYGGNSFNNSWSTFYGGNGNDYGTAITTDTLNNIIVGGYTSSTDIPVLRADSAYYQSGNAGGNDGFILKFNQVTALLNATYYGGAGDDYITDAATGINGNFAFTGRTNSTNFPLRNIGGYGYYQSQLADATSDAFIIKAANNLTVKWATYYGGGAMDAGTGVATDKTGRIYVSGFTFSHNFPVDTFAGAYNQLTNHGNSDGFIARFSDLGVRDWSTYKGDSCYQYPNEIAFDKLFNKFYVAGEGMLLCVGDTQGQSLPDTGQVDANGVSSIGFAWAFGGDNVNPCTAFGVGVNYIVQPCPGQCNGIAIAAAGGGRLPYSYIWNDGTTATTDSNSCPQESWVEVKDSIGCVAQAHLTWQPVNVSLSTTGIICLPGPGSVQAFATGGNGHTDLYKWSTSGNVYSDSTIIMVSDTGNYSVTVEDGRGCTVSGSAELGFNNLFPDAWLEVLNYPSCGANQDGVVALYYPNTDAFFPNGNIVWEDANLNVIAYGDTFYNASADLTPYYAVDSAYCYNGVTSPVYYEFNLDNSTNLAFLQTYPPSSCISNDGQGYVEYNYQYASISQGDVNYFISFSSIDVDNYPAVYYEWSDGEGGANAYNLGTGTTTVTVTDGLCQTGFSSTDVLPEPQVNFTTDSVYCNGGGISVSAYSQYGNNFTYQWEGFDYGVSGSSNSSPISNLVADWYNVTVTDAGGCSDTALVYVGQGTPLEMNVTASPALCNGGDGTITVTGSAGVPTYQGTGTFAEPPGTHSFTITDNAGCTASGSATVTQPAPIVVTVDSIAPIFCNGGTETILVNASGGTPPYTGTGTLYETAGTHVITVHDANGCTGTQTIVVTGQGSGNPIVVSSLFTPILCYGDSTTITITATGGQGTLTGTGTFTRTAGTYYFTVSDANGCSAVDTVVVGQPGQLSVNLDEQGITCQPGTVSAIVFGGSGPYQYQWSTLSGFGNDNAISVSSTGICEVTVQDDNGCFISATASVDYDNSHNTLYQLTYDYYPNCDSANGIISINDPYPNNITWGDILNGVEYTEGDTLKNLPNGSYAIAAIDSANCFNGQPTVYDIRTTAGPQDGPYFNRPTGCNTSDAFLEISTSAYPAYQITYGIDFQTDNPFMPIPIIKSAPLVYVLTNGNTIDTFSLPRDTVVDILLPSPGFSSLLWPNVHICQNLIFSDSLNPLNPSLTAYYRVDSNLCRSTIQLTGINNHLPGYTGDTTNNFLWSNGATTASISNLSNGIYTVTITGPNACPVIDTFIITGSAPIVASNTYTPISCYGDSTTLTITATGGHPPYTGTGTFRVTAGTYYYVISDSVSCSVVDTVVVGQPGQLSVSLTENDVTCNPGSVNAIPEGGTGTDMFQWSTSPGNYVSDSYIAVADTGNYSVTVQDGNGCVVKDSIYVHYYNSPITLDSVFYLRLPGCGLSNGVAYIKAANPSEITWELPDGTIGHGDTIRNIPSNTSPDVVVITDSSGCQNGQISSIQYQLETPHIVSYNIYHWNEPSGCNTKDGDIDAANLYPFPSSPYNASYPGVFVSVNNSPQQIYEFVSVKNIEPVTYQWSDSETYTISSFDSTTYYGGYAYTYIQNLNPGNYSVTITDGSCVFKDSITLTATQPELVASYTVTEPACGSNNQGSVSIDSLYNNITDIYGSNFNQFQWSNGDTTQSVSGLSSGTYTVTITGPNACPVIDTFNITAAVSNLAITNAITPVVCFNGTATVTVNATGGTPPYTGTGVFYEPAGSYVLTVTDSSGCTANDSVVVPPSLATSALVTGNSITPVLCHGGTATVTVSATGGVSPYTGTGVYVKPAGTYVVLVTDSLGCSVNDTLSINQPGILYVTKLVSPVLCYGGNAAINLSCYGGTGPYTGTGVFTRPAGNYVFIITDANGCAATDTIAVTQPAPLIVTDTVTSNALCYGGTGIVHVVATGGTAPYYGAGTIVEPAGNNLLVVYDQNGCADTLSAVITQPTPVNVAIQWIDTVRPCRDTVKVGISVTGGTGPYTGAGTIVYTHSGNYTITVSDANGCTVDSTLTIHLDSCVDVKTIADNFGVSIYPNPATDKLYMKFMSPLIEPADVRLYAVDGKLIMLKTLGAGTDICELNCNLLASGVYVLRTIASGREYNFKVVVTR